MKVVLFCGGLGMRIREYSDEIPKPMVPIGYRPILWHLMKYYAHFGHRDFVLCLGYKADVVKNYFLNYDECLTNDFVLSEGGNQVSLVERDIANWKITFTDTGITTNIGGRLVAAHRYVQNEDVFLANYTDNLSDMNLDDMVKAFLESDATAAFVCVKPNVSFHVVRTDDANRVLDICNARQTELWTNGGFFIFRREIFDYINDGEELIEEPFQRLVREGKLLAFRHDGFWACMDTYKEKQQFDDLIARGAPPWRTWERDPAVQPDPVEPPPSQRN